MKSVLINWTPEPAKTIASRVRNYRGHMVHSLDEISNREATKATIDVFNTHLQGPLEAVMLNFNVFDIPRWMTHQMVRTRIGAGYSETSLRFTLVDDDHEWYHQPFDDSKRCIHDEAMNMAMSYYYLLIKEGAPTQDARGVLPMDTLTHIGLDCNYRALVGVAASRLCQQAHPLWTHLIKMMRDEVRDKMGNLFANYLMPLCVHMQCCPFGSMLDRPCPRHAKYPLRPDRYWLV